MKKIGWRRALTAALLLSLFLSSSGLAPPATALSPRSAAQEKIAALTASSGVWIQPWDKSGKGPYHLILGQGTERVRLTPVPEDASGHSPTMELFAQDPAVNTEALPIMSMESGQPSEPIAVAPGVVQSYWLRSTNWNGDNVITYKLELYRTPIATEFRIADIQEVNGAKQLSLEIWMDAAVATGLKTIAVDFAFDSQKLQLANAETNEPVSAVSPKVGTWHESLTKNMKFASTVDNSAGTFHLELQARNNSDNTATLTCPVAQGRTLMATVAFRLAAGAALEEETLTVENMWCTELTPENRVLKTAGNPSTGYYNLTGLLPPDLPEPETVGCTVTITDLDGKPLSGTVLEGTPVRMAATPSPGRRFVRWEQVDRTSERAAAADLTREVIEVPYSATTTYRPTTAQAEHISSEEYDVLPVMDNLILGGIQGRELVRRALAQGDVGFTGLCLQYDLYLKRDETAIGLTPVFRDKWDVTWSVDGGERQRALTKETLTVAGLADGNVIHFYVNAPGREDVPIEYTVTVHWAQPELLLRAEPFETTGTALSLIVGGGRFYAIEFSFDIPSGMESVEPMPLAGYEYKCVAQNGRMTVVIHKKTEENQPAELIDGGTVLTLNFPGTLNLSELNSAGRVTTDTHMDVSVAPKIEGMVQVSGAVWSYNTLNIISIEVKRRLTEGDTYAPYATITLLAREQVTVRAFAQDFSLSLESGYFYELVITKAGHVSVTLTDLVVGTEDISLIANYGSQLGRDGIHLPCGDGNNDGSINVFDKAELTDLLRYGGPANGEWDLDGDGYINVFDLGILTDKTNYGKQKTTIQLKEGGA